MTDNDTILGHAFDTGEVVCTNCTDHYLLGDLLVNSQQLLPELDEYYTLDEGHHRHLLAVAGDEDYDQELREAALNELLSNLFDHYSYNLGVVYTRTPADYEYANQDERCEVCDEPLYN